MQAIAATYFAPRGLASLACDARGVGLSGGSFDLDGPATDKDTHYLAGWLAALPMVSNTKIGAFGWSLGGGAVWNAAAAGVPFKAIAVGAAWTSLQDALWPDGVPRNGLIASFVGSVRDAKWDPASLQALSNLVAGHVTPAATAVATVRSSRPMLHSLTVPTLILQGRHDFLFDLGQALAAYRRLAGKKALYIGDFGHAPAANPPAEKPFYFRAVTAWFKQYLSGGPSVPAGVELAHDPWNKTAGRFTGLPTTRAVRFTLRGTNKLAAGKFVSRSVRLSDKALQTFGGSSIDVQYSGAGGWTDRLVATVSLRGGATPVTEGAAPLGASSGSVRIPLLDEAVGLPRNAKLVITIGTRSANGDYKGTVPRSGVDPPQTGSGPPITIGRIKLKLSVLRHVSFR